MMINEPISPTGAWVHTSAVFLNHEAITFQLQIDSSDSHGSREHAWIDTDDCFTQMNIFTAISKEMGPPVCCVFTPQIFTVWRFLYEEEELLSGYIIILRYLGFTSSCPPAPQFLFAVFNVWIPYSCWSPDWVKFQNKKYFLILKILVIYTQAYMIFIYEHVSLIN